MPEGTAAYSGSERLAALLRLLREEPRGILQSDLPDLLSDKVEQPIPSDASFERWVREAIQRLGDYGEPVRVAGRGPTRRLVLDDVADGVERRWLPLDGELTRLRSGITTLLDTVDSGRGLIEPDVLIKGVIPRDEIEFNYGPDRETVTGIPYHWLSGRLWVRTQAGAHFSYEVRAIQDLRVLRRRRKGIDGPSDPPVVEAGPRPPGASLGAPRLRGRSENLRALRDAGTIARAVRDHARVSADEDGFRELSLTEVAPLVGLTEQEAANKAAIVTALDPAVLFWDDAFHIDPHAPVSPTRLDGSGALFSRLELAAVEGLGGAERDVGIDLDPKALGRYRSALDGFLDRAVVTTEACPRARRVIAAALDDAVLEVRLGTSGERHTLRPADVRLTKWRWFVTGELDGQEIAEGGLPIARITAAELID